MRIHLAFLLWAAACQPPSTGDDDQLQPTSTDADTGEDTASTSAGTDEDADGYTTAQGDCDDQDADIHPAAEEDCTLVDRNCDGDPTEGLLFGLREERRFPGRPNKVASVQLHWYDLSLPALPAAAGTNRLWDPRIVQSRAINHRDDTVLMVTEFTLEEDEDTLTLTGQTMAPEGALDLAPAPVEFTLSYETRNTWRLSDGAHLDHYYGWPYIPREYQRVSTHAAEGYVSSETVTESGETFTIDYTVDTDLQQTTATYSPTPSLPDEDKEWNTVIREHDEQWRMVSERIEYDSGWVSIHELEYDAEGRITEDRWGSVNEWNSGTTTTWQNGFPSRVTTHNGTGGGVPYFHTYTPHCDQPNDWQDHVPEQR